MEDHGHRAGNLKFEMTNLFEGVDCDGRAVLDIGAGEGDTSLYAACMGASTVVGLEPEAAGSHGEMRGAFELARDSLGLQQVELLPETLQEFDSRGQKFDVLVSKASINHLNEDLVIRLHRDQEARNEFLRILGKLAELSTPGAHLIVADASRLNFADRVGLKNPMAPRIEWEKHQQPKFWARMLEEVGFGAPKIRWATFNSLRRPGQVLLGNRIGAYFTTSSFCLTMQLSPGHQP